jgi:hypothetical protein
MASRLVEAIRSMGEEEFARRMEALSGAERRAIFQELDVPQGGFSASARQRNLRRIHAAWSRLAETGDEEAAERFARSWLARGAMPMIIAFLDAMGVEHREGYLREEDALRGLDPGRVAATLSGLAADHDAADLRLYAALMDLPDRPSPG